ncbi:MAG: DUF2490 domain-containing protein [Crocinitomicaceae bacterium]|nr:DUF2490 domain-containing protein [Crocinitomicaceae bacterium]
MKVLFSIITLVYLSSSLGQIQDANLWLSAGINADLTDKLSVNYSMETRFYKNASVLDSYINEIGAGYEIVKNLQLGIDYRYSRKNQEGYFEGVHRIGADISYSYKLDIGLTLKARARYQLPFNYLGVINDAIYPDNRNVSRFKISAKYKPTNLKKVLPYTGYEIYKSFSPKNQYSAIDSYRFTFGVTFDLPKRHSVDLYYMLEKEYRSAPQLNHIYGIQYNYDLFKDPVFAAPADK